MYIVNMEKILSALAELGRLQIIELLRERQQLTVGEIADRLKLRQSQASKHLRVLRDTGLVDVHPVGNRRIYKLRGETFEEIDNWLNSYRYIWEERLDRLDDYQQDLQRKGVSRDNRQE